MASGVLSAALSVMLDASWLGIGLAGLLGLLVGVTVQATESVQRQYQALVTVGISFAVSTVVLTLTMLGLCLLYTSCSRPCFCPSPSWPSS